MAFTTINPAISADQFNQFYASHNNNANWGINSMAQAGNAVTFYNLSGGTFGTINLPLSPNVILSGLVASSIGFALSTTAGTYQVANIQYAIGAGGFTITAAHPTLNRIDVLVVNNLGAYLLIDGTPAVNAVAPAITLNQLAVTYINVPAAGVPVINNSPCCIPDGVTTGQTLRWDNTASNWQISNDILSTVNQLTLQAANIVSLSTTGVQKGYFYADDTNSKIGVEVSAGNFEEVLVTQFGVEFTPSGVIESHFNMGLQGGISLPDNTPAVTTNRLYNIGGSLWFNGNELCIAPCGGGGLPIGTVDYSTLRWDNTLLDWVENIYNIANDNKYNLTCSVLGFLSMGVGNIATGILFSNSGGSNSLQSNASVIMTSGASVNINHIPTISTDGNNTIIGSVTSSITLHADYNGRCLILGSNSISITNASVPVTTDGQAFSIASYNGTIGEEMERSGTIGCDDVVIYNTKDSGTIFSQQITLGTFAGNMTNYSGLIYSQNSNVTSVNAISNYSVIIGGNSCDIDSGSVCGIFSSVGSQIKAYTGVGAIKCINSAIIGGNTNTIDPTGTANIQQCIVIGGVSNNLTGGAGNATNSAIISSTSSDITPAGAGNRIVVIGCNSVSATKNNTTYLDGIDTQGSHTYSSIQHVTTNTYNVASGDHIIACLNTALFVTQTIFLPATPQEGDTYIIENPDGSAGGVGTITVDGNGNNINGGATVVLNTAYISRTVRYYAGTVNAWILGM